MEPPLIKVENPEQMDKLLSCFKRHGIMKLEGIPMIIEPGSSKAYRYPSLVLMTMDYKVWKFDSNPFLERISVDEFLGGLSQLQ